MHVESLLYPPVAAFKPSTALGALMQNGVSGLSALSH